MLRNERTLDKMIHALRSTFKSSLIGALLLAAGCSQVEVAQPNAPTVNDPLVSVLLARGFRADMIVDRGAFFLVEGDIRFYKQTLAEEIIEAARPKPQLQAATTGLLYHINALNIRVNLTALSGYSAWATAARDAMAEWSAMTGTSVEFTETGSHITVSAYSETCPSPPAGCTLAEATFPAGGGPGPTIYINVAFNQGNGAGGAPTTSAMLNTMVHEFGHTIGFRHTNWASRGEPVSSYGANTVPGTPTTDEYSVMNGGTANSEWAGFSYYDRLATRKLYLGFGPVQSGSIASGHPKLTWSALDEASSYNIRHVTPEYDYEQGLWIDGATTTVGTTSGTDFTHSSASSSQVITCAQDTPFYYVTASFPGGITTYGSGVKVCFN